MDIEVKFVIDGREISLDKEADTSIEKAMGGFTLETLAGTAKAIQQALADTHCPVHYDRPGLTIVLSSSAKPKYRVSACCHKLLNSTGVAIKNVL